MIELLWYVAGAVVVRGAIAGYQWHIGRLTPPLDDVWLDRD